MDSIEYTNRRNRMFELAKCGKYKEASKEADAIDWNLVQNEETIEKVSMIYHKCRHYKDSLRLMEIIYHRNPKDIKIIKRICVMAAALGLEEKAWKYYKEYCVHEKSSAAKYILKYRIQRAVKADVKQCILTLHELLKIRYVPKWALELAECYAQAGLTEESIQECCKVIQETKEEECRQKAEKLRAELGWTEEEDSDDPEEETDEPESEEELVRDVPAEEEETEEIAAEEPEEDPDDPEEEAEELAPEEDLAEEMKKETAADELSHELEQKLAGLSRSYEQDRKKEQKEAVSQQDIESLLRQIQ